MYPSEKPLEINVADGFQSRNKHIEELLTWLKFKSLRKYPASYRKSRERNREKAEYLYLH